MMNLRNLQDYLQEFVDDIKIYKKNICLAVASVAFLSISASVVYPFYQDLKFKCEIAISISKLKEVEIKNGIVSKVKDGQEYIPQLCYIISSNSVIEKIVNDELNHK